MGKSFHLMKFLFISPRYSGGIGGHASMLADQLINEGYDVKKMIIPHIPIKNLKNPSFAMLGTIKGIMNREQYDIVHAFNVPSAFAMNYVQGKKKILSIHGVFSEQIEKLHSRPLSSIASLTESKIIKWADRLTTDSKFSKQIYEEKYGLDFEYLPSPIDTNKMNMIKNTNKKEKQIIYLGRNSYEKGIDILKKIESKINGKVVFCIDKSWEDAMELLKSSSILVVPSRMESLPTNIKEAFYLKVPVIATSVGGIPELVEHNKTGILVEPENPKVLLDKINQLIDDEILQQKFSINGYNFIKKNFTWEKILPDYIKFYKNLFN